MGRKSRTEATEVPVVTSTHRIYRIQWYRSGDCRVTSIVNGSVAGEFVGGQWDANGRLPDDVRAYAESVRPTASTAPAIIVDARKDADTL